MFQELIMKYLMLATGYEHCRLFLLGHLTCNTMAHIIRKKIVISATISLGAIHIVHMQAGGGGRASLSMHWPLLIGRPKMVCTMDGP